MSDTSKEKLQRALDAIDSMTDEEYSALYEEASGQNFNPRIIQFAIGPENQKYQGKLIGLANNGKIYIDSPVYDKDDNLVEGKREWVEIKIDFPVKKGARKKYKVGK